MRALHAETPDLRWFEAFPKCRVCGKTAHGLLRGVTNESWGHHCTKCAERRLRDSKRVREAEAASLAATLSQANPA